MPSWPDWSLRSPPETMSPATLRSLRWSTVTVTPTCWKATPKPQLDALKSVIDRLPATTSNEYETYILSVIAQCVKAEMLAASSWRVAVNAGADSHEPADGASPGPGGYARGPAQANAHQFECAVRPACAQSSLPETIIAALSVSASRKCGTSATEEDLYQEYSPRPRLRRRSCRRAKSAPARAATRGTVIESEIGVLSRAHQIIRRQDLAPAAGRRPPQQPCGSARTRP